MTRKIRVKYGENKIYITDRVENRDCSPCPYMMLYHFNMGYPLLDEDAVFITNARFLRPRDEEAQKGESERMRFHKPQPGFKEHVFYYKSEADESGRCYAGLFNEKLNTGVKIWTDPKQLPNVVQWRNAGVGDYVMGIEPANCYPEGREKQKEYGLDYVSPFESRTQELCVEII
jgi:galactose mutarotase-like enzyme